MKKQKKEQTATVNYVWALAGCYLAYLGGKLLYGLVRGENGSTPLVVIPTSVLFIAVGVLLVLREVKAYKYAMEHKDDPSTWNDELAAEAAAKENAVTEINADLPTEETTEESTDD